MRRWRRFVPLAAAATVVVAGAVVAWGILGPPGDAPPGEEPEQPWPTTGLGEVVLDERGCGVAPGRRAYIAEGRDFRELDAMGSLAYAGLWHWPGVDSRSSCTEDGGVRRYGMLVRLVSGVPRPHGLVRTRVARVRRAQELSTAPWNLVRVQGRMVTVATRTPLSDCTPSERFVVRERRDQVRIRRVMPQPPGGRACHAVARVAGMHEVALRLDRPLGDRVLVLELPEVAAEWGPACESFERALARVEAGYDGDGAAALLPLVEDEHSLPEPARSWLPVLWNAPFMPIGSETRLALESDARYWKLPVTDCGGS